MRECCAFIHPVSAKPAAIHLQTKKLLENLLGFRFGNTALSGTRRPVQVIVPFWILS